MNPHYIRKILTDMQEDLDAKGINPIHLVKMEFTPGHNDGGIGDGYRAIFRYKGEHYACEWACDRVKSYPVTSYLHVFSEYRPR